MENNREKSNQVEPRNEPEGSVNFIITERYERAATFVSLKKSEQEKALKDEAKALLDSSNRSLSPI